MNILQLLELYGIGEEDWEEIAELKGFFSEEFKKKLGEKTKEFVLKELPVSSQLLESLRAVKAFDSTIERFFEAIFEPEKLKTYVNVIAKTHARFEIPPDDFIKSFLSFFKFILDGANVPPEKISAFRKFVFILVAVISYIVTYHWLVERKERELDPITKLPSKKHLMSNLPHLIKSSKTVVLLDIDEFREVNLYFGYNAGNSVLAFVASALQLEFEGSFITRLQSDDFIIFTELPKDAVLEKLKNLKKSFESKPVTIPTSSGIEELKIDFYAAVLDVDLVSDVGFGVLIWILWNALEKAKWSSLSGIRVVDAADVKNGVEKRNKAFSVVSALNKGLVRVALQDVVDVRTKRVVFKEALARIIVDSCVVSAGSFIEAISGTNVERELDKSVVVEALELLKSGKVDAKISVNLSADFIKRHSVWFLDAVKRFGISPSRIVVELTERSDLLESKEVRENLSYLKENGVEIYVDDFGVKYANYNLLRELPVDGLKIDGSIVKNLESNELDRAFVSCVLQIAKLRKLKIVAEYVETQEVEKQLERLAERYNIDSLYIQGYLFGKPELIA